MYLQHHELLDRPLQPQTTGVGNCEDSVRQLRDARVMKRHEKR